jgi:hypothetical protein
LEDDIADGSRDPVPPATPDTAAVSMAESRDTVDDGDTLVPPVVPAVAKTANGTRETISEDSATTADGTSTSCSSTSFIDDDLRLLLDQVVVCCEYALIVTGF